MWWSFPGNHETTNLQQKKYFLTVSHLFGWFAPKNWWWVVPSKQLTNMPPGEKEKSSLKVLRYGDMWVSRRVGGRLLVDKNKASPLSPVVQPMPIASHFLRLYGLAEIPTFFRGTLRHRHRYGRFFWDVEKTEHPGWPAKGKLWENINSLKSLKRNMKIGKGP